MMLAAVKKLNEEKQPLLGGLFDPSFSGLLAANSELEPLPKGEDEPISSLETPPDLEEGDETGV
jgi:hypothetical protein